MESSAETKQNITIQISNYINYPLKRNKQMNLMGDSEKTS